jgi:hypothetical protein
VSAKAVPEQKHLWLQFPTQGPSGSPLVLRIAWDAGRLTPNKTRGMHWAEVGRLSDHAKTAARVAYYAAGCPEIDGKVRISIVVRRPRRTDPDATLASVKPIVDALFCRDKNGTGITPDDSDRYVEYGSISQETGARWRGCEEVEIRVESLAG